MKVGPEVFLWDLRGLVKVLGLLSLLLDDEGVPAEAKECDVILLCRVDADDEVELVVLSLDRDALVDEVWAETVIEGPLPLFLLVGCEILTRTLCLIHDLAEALKHLALVALTQEGEILQRLRHGDKLYLELVENGQQGAGHLCLECEGAY